MTNQLELKIYELETALADYKARIVYLEDRIEYLSASRCRAAIAELNKKNNDTAETR